MGGRRSSERGLGVAAGILAAVAVIICAILFFRGPAPRPAPSGAAVAVRRTPATRQEDRTSDHPPATKPSVASQEHSPDANPLEGLAVPASTAEQLAAKGLPLMSPPRKKAYLQTVHQSTEEVVADLGNFFTLSNSGDRNVQHPLGDMARWSALIPTNVKVLRLIEEGRQNPDAVAPLLRAALAECLANYDRARDVRVARLKQYQRGEIPNPVLSEDDPQYERTKKYQDPFYEFDRLHYVMYASLYVLANIDRLGDSGQLLGDWLARKKPDKCECKPMDAWLVDQYFRTAGGPGAERHRDITKQAQIAGRSKKAAAWNAPWSLEDPMILATGVNMADVKTLDVLDLPPQLPLDEEATDQVLSNFKAAVGAK
jgi:hypothetical protein